MFLGRNADIDYLGFYPRKAKEHDGEKLFFSNARTALKYGISALKLPLGSEILIPDFICDVVLHPIKNYGYSYNFYSVNNDLLPDFKDINRKISSKTKAIMMVHYFGVPSCIHDFIELCNEKGLCLIEDNAHGYGCKFNDRPLGSFGDIGILSPRKQFPVINGGILLLNRATLVIEDQVVCGFSPMNLAYETFRSWVKVIKDIKSVRKYLLKRSEYENINGFTEEISTDCFCMDQNSCDLIDSYDLNSLSELRTDIFKVWDIFSKQNDLLPVFNSDRIKNIQRFSPWVFPAFVKKEENRAFWFNWGWEHGIDVFSWPSLPSEVISSNSGAVDLWKKLICFPININMNAQELARTLNV